MVVKTCCPCCGAYTEVDLVVQETIKFHATGLYPKDFYERSVCNICEEDGYRCTPDVQYNVCRKEYTVCRKELAV